MSTIGILHPGEMGISIAASALNAGHDVCWLSTGRSDKTRLRAEQMRLLEIKDLSGFCQACEIIVEFGWEAKWKWGGLEFCTLRRWTGKRICGFKGGR